MSFIIQKSQLFFALEIITNQNLSKKDLMGVPLKWRGDFCTSKRLNVEDRYHESLREWMTTFLLVTQMNYCNQKFAGAIKFVVTSFVPPKGETE